MPFAIRFPINTVKRSLDTIVYPTFRATGNFIVRTPNQALNTDGFAAG